MTHQKYLVHFYTGNLQCTICHHAIFVFVERSYNQQFLNGMYDWFPVEYVVVGSPIMKWLVHEVLLDN